MSDQVATISQVIGEVEEKADTVKHSFAQTEATPPPTSAVSVTGSDEVSEDDIDGSDDISMAEPTENEEAPYEAPARQSRRRRTTRRGRGRGRGGSRGRGRSRSRSMRRTRSRSRRKPAGARRY